MKKYKVENIICMFGLFLDDEIEAESEMEAKELIMEEIIDNIGNYIEIELEEIEEQETEEIEEQETEENNKIKHCKLKK